MNGLSITKSGVTEKRDLTEMHLREQMWPIRFGIVVKGFKSSHTQMEDEPGKSLVVNKQCH
jgi:hypothetical protein